METKAGNPIHFSAYRMKAQIWLVVFLLYCYYHINLVYDDFMRLIHLLWVQFPVIVLPSDKSETYGHQSYSGN